MFSVDDSQDDGWFVSGVSLGQRVASFDVITVQLYSPGLLVNSLMQTKANILIQFNYKQRKEVSKSKRVNWVIVVATH